ncbi:MAG: ABC transporter ATP-binding protein [Pseudobdellovibrionaceae bacterium]
MAETKKDFITLEQISLTLPSLAGPVHILKDIHLRVKRGETLSVTGASGSGKSSMMMVMGGLQSQNEGRLCIGGQDLSQLNEDGLAAFRQGKIGIVFQNFHLIPTMTALENTCLPLEFAGEENVEARAREMLDKVGLAHRLDHYPSQLSGGEQQRVALARAMVARPELLLADEPTGNLDHETGQKIITLLFSLAQEAGTTLILITHDPELAKLCARNITLSDGEIISGGQEAA